VNPFNIPRANVLVHVRRMRLAFLGMDKAARVDKRLDSRLDRSTHRCIAQHASSLIAQHASSLIAQHAFSPVMHALLRLSQGAP
jgi:hypothetical protein